jgi:hypothetical protein
MLSTQVTTIQKILNWIDTYIVPIAAIGIGIFFFLHHYARPVLKNPYDVVYIEGRVADYSSRPQQGQQATLNQYYIWLDNYPCIFQIKADYLSYFYRSRFERDVKKGDSIRLSIPKVYENQLKNRKSKIFTLSVSKDSADYLRLMETIPKSTNNYDLYAGIFLVFAGGIYYFAKRKSIVRYP